MTLSAQVDGLRSQLSAVQQENNDLKRERDDRVDMERTWAARLDEVARGRSYGGGLAAPPPSPSAPGPGSHHRVGGKVRVKHKFPDGGAATFWETDASSDASDFDHRPKKKQRKHSPTPYRGRTSTPSPPRPRPSAAATHLPGPSRLPFTSNITSDTLVSSNTVELVVTPRHGGAPLGFIISPTKQQD
ncbi:hypothetical protein B0H13DRAFT_1918511 [Mycena leptocephala]|nr:hypothetical protein B0H13DRAFT_1918511 [Mycena leptocephala]